MMKWLHRRRLRFARIDPRRFWDWFASTSEEELRKPTSKDKEKLQELLGRLKGKDRVGVVADIATLVLGMLTGWGLAGVFASALGFSTLMTVFGVTVIFSETPVFVVLGSVVIFGLVAIFLNRLIRSGARSDAIRERLRKLILGELQEHNAPKSDDPEFVAFLEDVEQALEHDWLQTGMAGRVVVAVAAGKLSVSEGRAHVKAIVASRRAAIEPQPA